MTSKKKTPEPKAAAPKRAKAEAAPRPHHSAAYEEAVRDFGAGVGLLRAGAYAEALEKFRALRVANPREPELLERARTYETICERKLAPETREPEAPAECYLQGVVHANAGRLDEAIRLLDRAVAADPGSAAYAYARAAARALQGNATAAASDLRTAIRLDASCRHQAANDSDFERIRDEAVFIDVMDPAGE